MEMVSCGVAAAMAVWMVEKLQPLAQTLRVAALACGAGPMPPTSNPKAIMAIAQRLIFL